MAIEEKTYSEDWSDWDDEEIYDHKKHNGRKSMLPLYAFLIVKEETSKNRHMSQKDLLARLADYPYELEMDRKALGRTLRTMAAEELHIHCDRTGVWYDEDDYDEDDLAA